MQVVSAWFPIVQCLHFFLFSEERHAEPIILTLCIQEIFQKNILKLLMHGTGMKIWYE